MIQNATEVDDPTDESNDRMVIYPGFGKGHYHDRHCKAISEAANDHETTVVQLPDSIDITRYELDYCGHCQRRRRGDRGTNAVQGEDDDGELWAKLAKADADDVSSAGHDPRGVADD